MKYEPILDYVIVEVDEKEKKSLGGIVIPKSPDDFRHRQGKVIATGPGRHDNTGLLIPMQIKENDVVIFDGQRAFPLQKDKNHYCLREFEIFTKISK